MKLSHLAFSALLALGPFAHAGDKGECACDEKCQQECAEGKGEKCECKECGCKEGHCDHKKCEHHKDHKHGKGEAKKADKAKK